MTEPLPLSDKKALAGRGNLLARRLGRFPRDRPSGGRAPVTARGCVSGGIVHELEGLASSSWMKMSPQRTMWAFDDASTRCQSRDSLTPDLTALNGVGRDSVGRRAAAHRDDRTLTVRVSVSSMGASCQNGPEYFCSYVTRVSWSRSHPAGTEHRIGVIVRLCRGSLPVTVRFPANGGARSLRYNALPPPLTKHLEIRCLQTT